VIPGTNFGKKAEIVSYLAREGIRQRLGDNEFVKQHEALDEAMIGKEG
jgi:hypothetical protein